MEPIRWGSWLAVINAGSAPGCAPAKGMVGIKPADTMVKLHLSLLKARCPGALALRHVQLLHGKVPTGVSPSDRIQEMRGRGDLGRSLPQVVPGGGQAVHEDRAGLPQQWPHQEVAQGAGPDQS
ncbi:MAG: hypothetical protein MZV70_01375 [Desulfobacterales bacterium]|nr:hypothetical protein [Desulfobacterales bacterium]